MNTLTWNYKHYKIVLDKERECIKFIRWTETVIVLEYIEFVSLFLLLSHIYKYLTTENLVPKKFDEI